MKILVSNDDGVYSPGICALEKALSRVAEVTVIAPDRDRSAASKSLTLNKPLRTRVLENGYVSIDGTPADCIHLGLTTWLKDVPDMVVSGINAGANLGDDVVYSGTVAAATEGRFLGYPSLATSLVGEGDNYVCAAEIVRQLVVRLINKPLPKDIIINVNIPDLPLSEIKGFKVTRLGRRHPSEGMIKDTDPRGRTIYWVGPSGAEQDAGPGTDFDAIREGFVSLTPLEIDLTRYNIMDDLQDWAKEL